MPLDLLFVFQIATGGVELALPFAENSKGNMREFVEAELRPEFGDPKTDDSVDPG